MSEQVFGGNLVQTLNVGVGASRHVFAESPAYSYFLLRLTDEETNLRDLESQTIFVLKADGGTRISVSGIEVAPGEVVQAEKAPLTVSVKGTTTLLVAGTKTSSLAAGVRHFAANEIKKVSKPWGHELWLNGEHPGYAFKEIAIQAGTKTSLQYHRMKKETNVLFEGRAKLHYRADASVSNDLVSSSHLGNVELGPISSVDVNPNTLHRLEAVTDVILYEVSTPHLDDVIRVSDDANRAHGRIASEHGAA